MTTRPVLVALALVAFAANSILCRLALAGARIDAGSFTVVRLTSGAVALALLVALRDRRQAPSTSDPTGWGPAVALSAYAVAFSYAYLSLGAGLGALILFGAVQVTMVGWGLVRGDRPPPLAWVGLALALGGLVGLTAPGLHAPDPRGAAGMTVAGIAWGAYSLAGRGAVDPLGGTATNFRRTLPFVAALTGVVVATGAHVTPPGALLAATSGAVTSGGGYALWYAVLPGLQRSQAAFLQLLVPVLAAVGGIALLGEPVSLRLLAAGGAILGGVALAVAARA